MTTEQLLDLIKSWVPQLITASIAIISYMVILRQNQVQRRMDYLTMQQGVLRAAKAEYDALGTKAQKNEGDERHIALQLSYAKDAMRAVLDPKLTECANQLRLEPLVEDDYKWNQAQLEMASVRLADLIGKSWKSAGK